MIFSLQFSLMMGIALVFIMSIQSCDFWRPIITWYDIRLLCIIIPQIIIPSIWLLVSHVAGTYFCQTLNCKQLFIWKYNLVPTYLIFLKMFWQPLHIFAQCAMLNEIDGFDTLRLNSLMISGLEHLKFFSYFCDI